MTSTAGEDSPVPLADLSAAHASVTLLERLADKLGARASVTAVYGEPITRDGITVIPAEIAAEVAAKALEHRDMEQRRLVEILGPDFHRQFEQATQYR